MLKDNYTADGQMSMFDLFPDIHPTSVGRMSPEHCHRTAETRTLNQVLTSKQCLSPLSKSSKKSVPIYLSLSGDGTTQESWMAITFKLPGESLMHSTNSLKDGEEYLLSHLLETEVPEKYYLSERACLGILRRSQVRGKTLPEVLRIALIRQAGLSMEQYEQLKKEWK